MGYQDSFDSEPQVCKCGLSSCTFTSCPAYDELSIPFDADKAALVDLWDRVDDSIERYNKMRKSKEKNKFFHAVDAIVIKANERGIKTNKLAPFKKIWW